MRPSTVRIASCLWEGQKHVSGFRGKKNTDQMSLK